MDSYVDENMRKCGVFAGCLTVKSNRGEFVGHEESCKNIFCVE